MTRSCIDFDRNARRKDDIRELRIDPSCFIPFGAADHQKCRGLLRRFERGYLREQMPHIHREIELLSQRQLKLEIEALCSLSVTYLSDRYLPCAVSAALCRPRQVSAESSASAMEGTDPLLRP